MGDVVDLEPRKPEETPPGPDPEDRWKGTHSPEHYARMNEARKAKGNLGGRPRRATKKEAREAALAELYPKALLVAAQVIDKYLETGEGEANALKSSFRVIDQVEGKARETIKQETTISAIRYETAAAYPMAELEDERRAIEGPIDVEAEEVPE